MMISIPATTNIKNKDKIVVVVVDDDEDILNLLGVILQLDGYQVHVFSNLVSALTNIKYASSYNTKTKDNYQLVITNIHSPIKYGLELAEIIKKLNSDIKVILSSNVHIDKRVLYNTRCDGYLQKPIDIDKFRRMIRKCLNEPEEIAAENFKSIEFVYS
jgi:DNA-binding NtrC family response regulator